MILHRIQMRYSIEPRDRIYVKRYGFLTFAKNLGKIESNKYGQKLIDSAKKSNKIAIKTAWKRAIQKAEATGDLIGNKIPDKITSASKKSPTRSQNDNTNNEIEAPKKDTYLQKKDNKLLMN